MRLHGNENELAVPHQAGVISGPEDWLHVSRITSSVSTLRNDHRSNDNFSSATDHAIIVGCTIMIVLRMVRVTWGAFLAERRPGSRMSSCRLIETGITLCSCKGKYIPMEEWGSL